MIQKKYLKEIKACISRHIPQKNIKVFIFGSAVKNNHFGDIDIGLSGKINENTIYKIKEDFEESTLPYFIDLIDFNKVSASFKNNVFNSNILWIKR